MLNASITANNKVTCSVTFLAIFNTFLILMAQKRVGGKLGQN